MKFNEVRTALGALLILAVMVSLLWSGASVSPGSAGVVHANGGIPFSMVSPPLDEICNYEYVRLSRTDIMNNDIYFDPDRLDEAQSCGTKVIVKLVGGTDDIVNTNGGLNLWKFENEINDFAGDIDPYVNNGTIIAHQVIDEPHDCQDWNGICPQQWKVDDASAISKEYWPTLLTSVNTSADYAREYNWVDTDLINFQYAYHKGDLTAYIDDALDVLNDGYVDNISWSIQAQRGGCEEGWGVCPMTPAQVEEVGIAMCNTNVGFYVGFERYDEALLTADMLASIDDVTAYCANPPAPTPTPPGTRVHVGDLDGVGAWQGTKWKATVTVTVRDQLDNLVSGVTVYGTYASGDTDTCTTASNGTCTMIRQYLPASVTKSILTITNITGYPYDSLANEDPDGSSDGTTIWTYKP